MGVAEHGAVPFRPFVETTHERTNDMSYLFSDAPVVHAYTRAEAIEDGVLVDVSETAREAGFRVPSR